MLVRGSSGAALLLTCSLLLQGCSPAGAPPPEARTVDPRLEWLRSSAHPVALVADGFEDLQFLRPLLESKRIVQLGENTHGVREYNLLKARIVRFLHQELGFEVLAFESALYQCFDADLTAAEAAAISTLTSCAFGTWHTREILPLFEYLKATRSAGSPLRLAGIDVQPIGRNKDDRPQFLASAVAAIDKAYAAEVLELDSTFLEVYARGGQQRRAYFRSQDGQRMADAYEELSAYLRNNRAAILKTSPALARDGVLVAGQAAASMAWYIRQQSAPTTRDYVERRDQGMAENLEFLLKELYPDRKVIVWGHNFHLRHDNLAIPPDPDMFPDVAARTMGSWIHERYGDELYTVGLYAYRGRASDNGGEVYEIEPAPPGSLEALLHGVGAEALFIDLSSAGHQPATRWIDEPTPARYNGTTALQMTLRDQYDGILFVDEVSPRVMLY